jgi:hypothetical protein
MQEAEAENVEVEIAAQVTWVEGRVVTAGAVSRPFTATKEAQSQNLARRNKDSCHEDPQPTNMYAHVLHFFPLAPQLI